MKHGSAALAGVALLVAGVAGFAAGWTSRGVPEAVVTPPPPAQTRSAAVEPVSPAPAEVRAPGPPDASATPGPTRPELVEGFPVASNPAPPLLPKQQGELLEEVGFSASAALDLRQRSERFERARLYLNEQSDRERLAARLELTRTQKREIGEESYGYMLWSAGIPNRVVVAEVLPDSSASRLGLRRGDVVLRYGGERVFERDELRFLVQEPSSRTRVDLEILRDGKVVELSAPPGLLGISVASSFDPPRDDLSGRARIRTRVVPPNASGR